MSKVSKQLYGCKLTCLGCGAKWKDLPRGPETCCPQNCGSKHIKWENYEKWIEATGSVFDSPTFGTWEETYGKLTGKQIKKLLRKLNS